ncbi:Alpha/Beta hydrolase protein [Talaromyces proteolyticus]|uniref:Alpha/Beta hydrolase protein n=1 Tax=Talaromyces proteolyticus TaxID=1131652 RepID=A0AAD4KP46_9EURO|nr:Alpha/Beta hydrolase protein [Talaromyces proteolyticus]KAH8696106.1 Alpha/Beta hydrolase protein [Talaromyces proteolyticus]
MPSLINYLFPRNPSFTFEALRAIGYASFGAADVAEVLSICSRIPSGDESGWLQEWRKAADRAVTNAQNSLAKGNTSGARDAFLRASNYYRTAEFYRRENPFDDDVSKELAELSSAMFFAGAELMPWTLEKVNIPYQTTTLPGIFIRPKAKSSRPAATVIVNGGYDSTKEEVGLSCAASMLELGFNVLCFDGPGQGDALRQQKLVFRYDWEKVVTPVIDYVITHPDVDQSKIVLYGMSMGGYLVARAAAFEHRAAAIVLNDGVYDFGSAFRRESPALAKLLIRYGWDTTVNRFLELKMRWNTGIKWAVLNGKWVFGVSSGVDMMRKTDEYTLEGIVENIKTPVLVLDAPDDHFLAGQPEELYKRLKCEKTFVQLTREEGASLHCHCGSFARLSQVICDYLMERLFQS